ncbi:protocadherin Fat 4-like [Saccoglossus kowalevskii]
MILDNVSTCFLMIVCILMQVDNFVEGLDIVLSDRVSVLEEAGNGDVIYTPIEATGQGANAMYQFAIIPNPNVSFPFELVQGPPDANNFALIRAVVPPGFDYDVITEYILEITVIDLNDNTQPAVTGIITVEVIDTKSPPRFTNLPATATIGELATVPELVKYVKATDDDTYAADISFNIVGSSPFGAPFQIKNVTYDLFAWEAAAEIQNANFPGFDFENGPPSYELYIEAVDNDGLSTTSTLTVVISDENEPIRITNLPSTIYLPESATGNVFLLTWEDEDVPTTTAAMPTFMISSTPSNGPFAVDTSGNIKVVTPGLNYLERTFWTITIYITDPDGLTDTGDLHVWVTDVNTGPDITNLDDTIQIGEMSSGGSAIFVVQAKDDDEDDYFCVMFSDPNDGNFYMNTTTNTIYVIDSPTLDFEALDEYILTVTCHDTMYAGIPHKLTVQITDENEAPEITDLPATVTVPEDAINSAEIYVADGYDIDGDDLRYSITVSPASGQGKFYISNTTNNDCRIKISNNPSFDFETIDQYIIVLEATDGEFTATGTLNVDITNTDEPPRFVVDNQDILIDEEQIIGTVVPINWAVIDVDDALTDLNFVMIGDTYSPYFSFTWGSTPELRVAQIMDYEAVFPQPFSITFTVTDPSDGKDYLNVNIYLQNINDNAPVFTQAVYTTSVLEMELYGTLVLQVLAIDDDVADLITYTIQPASLYFDIDTLTGDITVTQSIDLEIVGEMITFTVVATDNGSPLQQTMATVDVTVLNVDDNVPFFDKPYWNWEIRYDTDVSSYVNSVFATDADLGADNVSSGITYKMYLSHPRFNMETDGRVIVSDKLHPEQKYLLICYAEDNATPPHASHVATIRIDTFIPQLVLVDIFLGISVSEFTADKRREFVDTLNGIFTPWYFRISTVHTRNELQVTSRRLLENTAVVEAYALTSDLTEYQINVEEVKEFVYFQDLVGAMTIDSTGTPTPIITGTEFDTFPIVKVEPTYDVQTANSYNWWLDTLEGLITIGVLSSLPFIGFLCLMLCCCWKYRCCARLARCYKQRKCGCCKSVCNRSHLPDVKEQSTHDVRPSIIIKDDVEPKTKGEPLIVAPAQPRNMPVQEKSSDRRLRNYNGRYSKTASLRKEYDTFVGDKKPALATTDSKKDEFGKDGSMKTLDQGSKLKTKLPGKYPDIF